MPEPYTISTTLYKDSSVELYRGLRQRDDTPVIIKIVHEDESGTPERKRLHNEYEILQRLDSPYVLKPYAMDRQKAQMRLILEDFNGESLAFQLGQPLKPGRFFDIALPLAVALADIHRQDIVHKDIKPANILFNSRTGSIKLTGFGIAARLVHGLPAPTSVMLIEGSLAYMSPEQTGRMNRGIDRRSDLYSLGVIFYEMVTGSLPFQAADPLEWVHCHIARPPRLSTEIEPTIPEPLAAIVMRLLAKQAEDRYQTARGLKADLEHCAAEWQANKIIAPFPLGTRDVPSQLQIPKKLYGRKREVGTLLAAFNRVMASGMPELVLVSGYSGIGKSAVMNELNKALILPRTLFAGGKFDQYKRDIPYTTLSQALQTLVRHVLGKSEEEITQWREAIQEAVGPNGRLVTNLVPELVVIIGEQPQVQVVPPQDAQNRFNTVFQRLLGVFARPEHPLALFLDDLQWLDTATLHLLEHLFVHPEVKHILLIGAYRDNEVGPSHPLMLALDAMRNSGATVQSIILGPLKKEDVLRLTADTFHCEDERAQPLAQLVYEKTGGNPFFMIQFLTALAQEGLVAFDSREERWQWDLGRIQSEGFTDNVADLMVGKMSRLQAETQKGLQQLACLGSEARLATLALVQEISEAEAEKNLLEAIQAGFLLRKEKSVSFQHDRVQEAAYALIQEQQRPEIHLDIGRKLLSQAEPVEQIDTIFDVINHLNRGAGLMTDPTEKARLAELNVAAGRRAQASVAYETARDCFAAADSLLPEDTWVTRYDFQFAFYLDWAQAEYLHGAFEEAERLSAILLAHAKSDLDRVKVYDLRLTVYHIAGKYDDALAMAINALQLLGVDIPEDDEALNLAIEVEFAEVKKKLEGRKNQELAGAPEATDQRVKAVIGILVRMGGPAYIGSRPQLYPLTPLKALNYCLKYGVTKDTGTAFSGYALMLTSVFGEPHSGYAFSELAIELGQRFNDLNALGTTLFIHGNHVNFWLKPIASDFPVLERGFRVCLDGGNIAHANYIAYAMVWQAMERGDPLDDVLDLSRKYAGFALGSRNEAAYRTIVVEQQFLKYLMGETDDSDSCSDEGVSELSCVEKIAKAHFTCGIAIFHTMKMMAAYLMGDSSAARAHAEEAKKSLTAAMSQPMEAAFYFFNALLLARGCRESADENMEQTLKTLAAYQKKLDFWAKNCPENFACKHALVSAEIAEIEGDELSAERLFEQAIEAAKVNGFIHWQAMANEAAARFYADRGLKTASRAYLQEARDCYAQWGAHAKVKQLNALQPWLAKEDSVERGTIAARMEQLDVMAITKAQHAISGEISMDRLSRTLLRIVMESAGAQTGFLSVEGADQLLAEMRQDDDGSQRIVFETTPRSENAPGAIINYVRRSRDTVIMADASTEALKFAADDYLRRIKPRSVLCMAIQRQEKLIAVLYLENNLVTGAFTPEHRFLVEVLAAQAAISLETAGIYKELQASEQRFRLTLEAGQIGIFDWDVEHDIWIASPEYYTMLGYPPKDGPADWEEWMARVHQDDRDLIKAKRRPILAGVPVADPSHAYEYEARMRHVDGSYRWHYVKGYAAEQDPQGRITRMLGIRMDITERRQAEEEIARNLAINQALSSLYIPIVTAGTSIEQIADAVLEKSRQLTGSTHGYVAEIDPATGDLIAHTNTKMLQTVCQIAKDELRKTRFPRRADGLFNGLWGHALNTKEPFFTDMPAKHPASVGIPEGHLVIERFLTVPVLLSGELVGQIALSNSTRAYSDRDLDAVKRIAEFYAIAIQYKQVEVEIRMLNQELEQRVLDRTAELAASNKELEAFAYSVSHDLRAPVRHIGGFLELLQKSAGTALNEQSRHYMDTISGAAKKMGLLIDDLLSFSRMGRHAMSSQKVELGSLVGDVIRELEPEAAGRTIDWRIGDLPVIGGDAAMLRRVLVNLITNALKFTRTREQARIEIGSIPGQGSEAVIFVRDNGVGFDMAYADKLFNVFQRLHRTDEYEGTGIGLANVRRIIARHGGRTWAEGKVDQGAAFYFALPQA